VAAEAAAAAEVKAAVAAEAAPAAEAKAAVAAEAAPAAEAKAVPPVSVAGPALWVSVAGPALWVSVAGAVEVSMYTADAHFLDAASAAVVVAAEAVGAAELAGYGHPPGAGSTPAGLNLHLRVKKLASRRSKSHKQRWLRKRSDESYRRSSSDIGELPAVVVAAQKHASSPRLPQPRRGGRKRSSQSDCFCDAPMITI
jgi:hypothetical protein